MIVCPSCERENADDARFCSGCGAPLEAPAIAGREERKVVTVLFADLVGFTARAEQLDPEDVRGLLAPFHARLREELERFGGTVEKFIGDAVMALFGAPTAHEDDPERAVRAALAIRDWLSEQAGDLQVRLSVNTGEALITLGARPAEGEGMAAGDVINTAARLQSAAPVNGILVGETTYRATKHVIDYRVGEPVAAKGKAEPILVWEALQAQSRFGVDLAEARTPLVGRESELDALSDALDRARSRQMLQLVTLVGVPGIGKSRLVRELFAIVDAEQRLTTWRQGRSLPYGEGVSFWALAEIVKAQAGILESDSDDQVSNKLRPMVERTAADSNEAAWMTMHLGSLVGLEAKDEDAEVAQSERFAAWTTFLERLAEKRPLVLVFEDLHWADDGLLDFVDRLVERARSVPILVLCTARPELLERRPGWGGGKANAATLSLSPLEDRETARLLGLLVGRAVLPAETQAELLARAAGNPLYAEQYARMLAERGTSDELPLPETVQGIIAARLDVLSEREKALLQNAAVVGKVFWLGSVCAIGEVDRGGAEDALLGLERKEFVRRARRSSVAGEAEYAFSHLLVREVAYGQIPRAARASKHLAAANWVEGLGRSEDHAEMLASHYLRALEYARASGTDTPALVARTRSALREAGDRASGLHSWPAAARFYADALELWPKDDPEWPYVAMRCGRAKINVDGSGLDLLVSALDELEAVGDVEAAASAAVLAGRTSWLRGDTAKRDEYLERALALVGDDPDSPARVAALSNHAFSALFTGRFADVLELVDEALPAAERLGLAEHRVRLLNLRGTSRTYLGEEGGFADLDEAIALATEARAYEQLQNALNNRMTRQLAYGRLPEAWEAISAMEKNLARDPVDARRRWVEVVTLEVNFVAGNWDEARRIADNFLAETNAGSPHVLDPTVRAALASMLLAEGGVASAIEEAEAALAAARQGDELLRVVGARVGIVFIAAGRVEEAATLLADILGLEERVIVLNDALLTDAAWLACDLGRGDEYGALVANWPKIPWAVAAAAICVRDYRRGADVLEGIGYRPGEAYARLRAAEALVTQGRRGEAEAELHRALTFFREVSATRYINEAEALLAVSA